MLYGLCRLDRMVASEAWFQNASPIACPVRDSGTQATSWCYNTGTVKGCQISSVLHQYLTPQMDVSNYAPPWPCKERREACEFGFSIY